MQAADKSIPNKIVTIKPSDHPWITCHIKNMIRKRKRTFRQFKKTNINHYWLKYKTIRNNVVKEIRQSKQQYFDKLDQLLSSENIDPKEHLAIRRIFSLVDIITNTKFSNCPNVFEIGVV